jgi:2-polyprenyl-3-methyl-5-hydroxy-6-metoxy-1,4-benzoquinol methylase
MTTSPFPIQHAFVVQFAAETALEATGITGRVEHLVSGQAIRFRSVEALFAFMAARLQEVQQTATVENAADTHLQDQSLGKAARPAPRSANTAVEEKSMSTTITPLPVAHIDRRDALVTRLFEANLATYDLATIYLGDRLGLYTALRQRGPMTAAQLAAQTGTHERYIREWLEQQTVSGILEVADTQVDAAARRYGIPAGHAEVLLERDSLNYLAPLGRFTIGVLSGLTRVLEAFKTGGGVAYADYGVDAREGQAEANRTAFVNLLGAQWFPAIPDLHARLQAEPPARVADMACGTGWSSLAMARAYPKVVIDGFDSDSASIVLAQQYARAEGLHDRVTFVVRDAADQRVQGTYDLVTIFEALHDMPRPVEALRVARTLLRDGGSVLIADERVHEHFTPHHTDERLFYGWSVLFCLPTGMAETPSAGTGAVMRPDTLQRYAVEAGFRAVEVLPIAHDLWRFYRLYP